MEKPSHDKKGAGPPRRDAEPGTNRKSADHIPSLSEVQEQLALFSSCVFASDDLMEIRQLPSGRSSWHLAGALSQLAERLSADHAKGQQPYAGINPRATRGAGTKANKYIADEPCGRCNRCVSLARCLFVDLDRTAEQEARFRLEESGLLAPTLVVSSGGGIHLYWRLEEPIADLERWSRFQRGLITKLHGDPAIHDPVRLMRLPGFANRKYDPPPLWRILEADAARTYSIDEFAELEATEQERPHRVQARAAGDTIPEGVRNNALFRMGAGMRARGFTPSAIEATLLVQNQEQCEPPAPENEVRRIAKSAGRYRPDTFVQDAWEPFPVSAFPEPLRSIVVEGAAAIGCDPSMIALPGLAGCAGAIGTTRAVEIKRGWLEFPILWLVVVSPSGTLKSPSMEYALRPIREAQAARFREHEAAMARFERARQQYEADLSAWKKAKPSDRGEQPAKPTAPLCVRYVVSDCTVESLAPILEVNPRGVLVTRDELGGWFSGFNQYKKGVGSDVANWVELHRGGPITVDRKTGIRTIHVPRAAVSICGTIQPETLRRALTPEYFECGLAARPLMAAPPERVKEWSDRVVSESVIQAFTDAVGWLLALKHVPAPDGEPEPQCLPLSPDAKRIWVEWYGECAAMQTEAPDDRMKAALSKIEGGAARLALVYQLVAKPDAGSIGAEAMRSGVTLARWFAHAARRIYAMWTQSRDNAGRPDLTETIRRNGGVVSARDLMRSGPCYKTAEQATAALDELAKAGRGAWEYGPASGGHQQRRFRLFEAHGTDESPAGDPKNEASVSVSSVSKREDEVCEWVG